MKSDLELAVEASKRLESALEHYYGASGRGLHSKADSVADQLDAQVLRKLRYVATIRNKIVHEAGTTSIGNTRHFTTLVEELASILATPKPEPKGKPRLVPFVAPDSPEARQRFFETIARKRAPASLSERSLARFRQLRYRYRDSRKTPSLVFGALLFLVAIKLKLPMLLGLLLGGVGLATGYLFGSYLVVLWIATIYLAAVAAIVGLLYFLYATFA